MVLLRNSQRDGRKGGKLQQRWLGPYRVQESVGKGMYKLLNPSTGKALKKVVNVCRLKPYYSTKGPVFHFSDSSVFQTCSSSDETCSPIAVGCYRKKRIAISSSDDGCIQSSHDSQVKLESDRMVGHGACVVSTDACGIDDTICQISSVPVCQSVGDIVVSQQYSAPMSGVTKHLGQGSISDEVNKCHSTLCTGDIGFVDNELQLSRLQQTISFSETMCDINDGFVTSTPKKQCGFFVLPADISISPVCETEFKTTCVTPSATADTQKYTRRREKKHHTFAKIRDLRKREGLRSRMKGIKSTGIITVFL